MKKQISHGGTEARSRNSGTSALTGDFESLVAVMVNIHREFGSHCLPNSIPAIVRNAVVWTRSALSTRISPCIQPEDFPSSLQQHLPRLSTMRTREVFFLAIGGGPA